MAGSLAGRHEARQMASVSREVLALLLVSPGSCALKPSSPHLQGSCPFNSHIHEKLTNTHRDHLMRIIREAQEDMATCTIAEIWESPHSVPDCPILAVICGGHLFPRPVDKGQQVPRPFLYSPPAKGLYTSFYVCSGVLLGSGQP